MNVTQSEMRISSTAFAMNDRIPVKYTGEGEDISPPLAFSCVPDSANELVLICDDPDAPVTDPWVHWLIYGLPADVEGLPESVPTEERLSFPSGAYQGSNSWDRLGYGGPMPPRGHGVHHYYFKLYALDSRLEIDPGVNKGELLCAMEGHVIAEAELIGTYERK